MPIEIIVPRLGWSMEEGAFVAWLKKDGEFVRAGEAIFSIEGDKAVQEIESIDSGILRIAANGPKPGDPIRVGDVLGHLVSAGEAAREPAPATTTKAAASSTSGEAPPISKSSTVTAQVPIENVVQPRRTPAISPRALRAATELGVDWTTVTGSGRTGRIRERDIIAAAGSSTADRPATRHSPASFADGQDPSFLVTGGCGFIGTWVVRELLERGLRAVVLDAGERPARWERVIGASSEHVPLVRGSLLDRELVARVFAEHHVTRVIHLAALLTPACQADPWEGFRVNVLGSVALFEQVRTSHNPIQGFSYASSIAVFGDEPDHTTSIAGEGNHPLTFYGAFKKSVELIAEQYWRHFQIASVGIRPQVAYGPERDVGLTAGPSLAARAAARNEAFTINYTGRVGYDYVEDVARAFVRGALETPPGAHVVDLPGEVADVNQVIAAIGAVVPEAVSKLSVNGRPIPAHVPPSPRFISALYPDWKTTSLVEGIRRTIDFYRVQQTGKPLGKTRR
ncbi:MAG: NAD-dependent epimerase/dehydratase family protein [Tepidisphaeraceae bacterium]